MARRNAACSSRHFQGRAFQRTSALDGSCDVDVTRNDLLRAADRLFRRRCTFTSFDLQPCQVCCHQRSGGSGCFRCSRGLGAHRVGQHRCGHPSEDSLEVFFMHSPARSLAGLEVVTTCPVVQGFRATAGDGRAGCRRSGLTRARYVSFVEEGEEGLWPQSRLVQTAGVSPSFIQRPMLGAREPG